MITKIDDKWYQGSHLFFKAEGKEHSAYSITVAATGQEVGYIELDKKGKRYLFHPYGHVLLGIRILRDVTEFMNIIAERFKWKSKPIEPLIDF